MLVENTKLVRKLTVRERSGRDTKLLGTYLSRLEVIALYFHELLFLVMTYFYIDLARTLFLLFVTDLQQVGTFL